MLDQVEKLTRLGIKATVVWECQKDKGNEITILNGWKNLHATCKALYQPDCYFS